MKTGNRFLRATCLGVAGLISVAGCGKKSDSTPIGAGAKLQCSSGKNAFDTYGTNAFVAVNERIFTNVTNELSANGTTNLGNSFGKIGSGNPVSTADNLASIKGNLAAFLVDTYGGPSTSTYTDKVSYVGPQDMTESHLGLNIASAQYTYFVNNIVVPALSTNGVPPGDVSGCFAPPLVDSAFIASVVGH